MIKNFLMIALLLVTLGAGVSCVPASGDSLVIGFSPAAPTTDIDGDGAEYEIKVVASGTWSIVEGDILNAIASVSSGSEGITELTLTVEPNPSTTSSRPIYVRFTLAAGDDTKGFIVWSATQAQNEPNTDGEQEQEIAVKR